MKRFTRVFVVLIVLISVAACAASLNTNTRFIQDNLPKSYSGTFQWHGSESTQEVFIDIFDISTDSSGNVIADGIGEYRTTEGTTKINVKLQITPDTLRFEMWEMNPQGSGNFVTDGSHIGTISKDLRTIKAVWTTKSSGAQGDLLLQSK